MFASPDALVAFVLSAELGSFSAAARQLGKRQSTISEAIANLEIDLGVMLFDRQARLPTLSEAGANLLPLARRILAAQDALSVQARRLADGGEPRLSLVLSDTFPSLEFEAMLHAFAERFPATELACLMGEDADVVALVRSGRAHLGLLTAQPGYPADLAHQRLPLQAQTSLYVAASHPLASRNGCREADLREHRQLRLQTCQAGPADESGQLAWSAPSYLLLLELAQCGFGWAELPHWLAARYGQGLTALALPGWPRQRAMDAVWSRQRPPGPAQAWMLTQLAG